jgi:hypothetical protein
MRNKTQKLSAPGQSWGVNKVPKAKAEKGVRCDVNQTKSSNPRFKNMGALKEMGP